MRISDNLWRKEIVGGITDPAGLSGRFGVDGESLRRVTERYPMRITPYYLKLISGPGDPLWKQVVPDLAELNAGSEEEDPLQEEQYSPLPNLIHRYPDRVLWLVSNECALYCRFCTRKRQVGCRRFPEQASMREVLDYIRAHPEIRDAILSGGDPLLLPDDVIEELLAGLRAIEHIRIIRIGSRVPCVLPQRITPELVSRIRRYHPVYVNTHFNHPAELTEESRRACSLLADAGIPLGNQSVLLKGVNDDPTIMADLVFGLLTMRVKPYYLYQADPVRGTAHFRTRLEKGLEVIAHIRGNVSGMAAPTFVIDAPRGSGKLALSPDPIVRREEDHILLRSYDGKLFRYPIN